MDAMADLLVARWAGALVVVTVPETASFEAAWLVVSMVEWMDQFSVGKMVDFEVV